MVSQTSECLMEASAPTNWCLQAVKFVLHSQTPLRRSPRLLSGPALKGSEESGHLGLCSGGGVAQKPTQGSLGVQGSFRVSSKWGMFRP